MCGSSRPTNQTKAQAPPAFVVEVFFARWRVEVDMIRTKRETWLLTHTWISNVCVPANACKSRFIRPISCTNSYIFGGMPLCLQCWSVLLLIPAFAAEVVVVYWVLGRARGESSPELSALKILCISTGSKSSDNVPKRANTSRLNVFFLMPSPPLMQSAYVIFVF